MQVLLREVWRKKHLYVYLLPTLSLLAVFAYYPPISAMYHAFFDWNGANKSTFVGLANFWEAIFEDQFLRVSVVNVSKLMAFGIIVVMLVNLLVAELIFALKSTRGQGLYRLLFIAPMVVPGIVILLLWQFILDPNYGILNAFLGRIGLSQLQRAWLGDPDTALISFMIIGFPWITGVTLLIFLAGLQNISTPVLDMSKIDGATGLKRIWHIDIPLILGQIKLLVIMGVIGGLQTFGNQLILTDGGPGVSTLVPGLHMYQNAFSFDRMGYACALGFMMFIVILTLTYINMKFIKSDVES